MVPRASRAVKHRRRAVTPPCLARITSGRIHSERRTLRHSMRSEPPSTQAAERRTNILPTVLPTVEGFA
jgi:hypothetical protein